MLGNIINGTFTWGNAKAWVAGLFLTFTQIQADPASFQVAITDAATLGDALVVGVIGAMAVWAIANGKAKS